MPRKIHVWIPEIEYYQMTTGSWEIGGGMQPNTNTALVLACQLLYFIDLSNLWLQYTNRRKQEKYRLRNWMDDFLKNQVFSFNYVIKIMEVKPISVENTDCRLRSIKKIIAPIQVSDVFYPYHMTYRNTWYWYTLH